jgi:WD40 repeat protein
MKTMTMIFLIVALLGTSAFSLLESAPKAALQAGETTPTSEWQATLQANQTQNAAYAATQGAQFTATALAPTATPTATYPPAQPTNTPLPTATLDPMTALPQATPLTYQNTPAPQPGGPLSAANVDRLKYVAQWGRGSITRVAFTADGKAIIIASSHGLAVYDAHNLDAGPRWLPFDQPITFTTLQISMDSQYVSLKGGTTFRIFELASGLEVAYPEGVEWLATDTDKDDYRTISITSSDGALEFFGASSWDCIQPKGYDYCYEQEVAHERMTDLGTGEIIFDRTNPIPSITYSERSSPEGCDLDYFGYCGNAFAPVANSPFRAAFSPSGNSIAVLYRPGDLWDTPYFSVLRVYRVTDGKLLAAIGTYGNPVEDFAFAPESDTLVAGFVNGTMEVWDIASLEKLYAVRHFDSPIQYLTFTADSAYVLIQRARELEIRRTSDGALRARFDAVTFDYTPITNRLALANYQGQIRIIDLETWEDVHVIAAHSETIFALAFSPDGSLLASSGQDCAIRVWDARTGEFLHYNEQTVVDAYGEGFTTSRIFIKHMRWLPGTNQLIGFGSWGTVVSWDVDSGARNYIVGSAPLDYYNGMMTINPHFPEYFALDNASSTFYINELGYSTLDGTFVGPYQPAVNAPADCYEMGPTTADATLRFTRGYDSREGKICVLDNYTLEIVNVINVMGVQNEWLDDTIGWVYLTPDGNRLVTYSLSGVIYVYQVNP